MVEITEAEERAITQLQRTAKKAKRCGLQLFSSNGTMYIIKPRNGKLYQVGMMIIDNDGGDPGWDEDEEGTYIRR